MSISQIPERSEFYLRYGRVNQIKFQMITLDYKSTLIYFALLSHHPESTDLLQTKERLGNFSQQTRFGRQSLRFPGRR